MADPSTYLAADNTGGDAKASPACSMRNTQRGNKDRDLAAALARSIVITFVLTAIPTKTTVIVVITDQLFAVGMIAVYIAGIIIRHLNKCTSVR